MNKLLIFNKFANLAQSDNEYYIFGKPSQIGIIEDLMAYLGLDYNIESNSMVMHNEELNTLKDFILNNASNEQLLMINNFCDGINPLPKINPISPSSGNVFVSMPMNKNKCSYVDEIRQGMELGIKNSNNKPYFLDKEIHCENIFTQMMKDINSCKFLIADLSTQNTGVYYEAGYAKALGKTVILTCKEDDFENVHFDLKQTQMIIWKDSNDLSNKLTESINKLNLGGNLKC